MSSEDAALVRLQALDTCAVSDALDRLGLPGTALGIRQVTTRRRIAGRVVPVKLGPAGDTPAKRHLCSAAIEAATAANVIVVEHRSRDDAAGWGGLLSTAACVRGVAGTIVDGSVRDVDDSRALGYSVFARGVVPATARGRVAEHAWNEPIVVGGVDVKPGDLVIADGSGVVFIDAARSDEVLDLAESIAALEAMMTTAVRNGTPVSQVMGRTYESMAERRSSDE
jgi:regulator of RNase E activity RraA